MNKPKGVPNPLNAIQDGVHDFFGTVSTTVRGESQRFDDAPSAADLFDQVQSQIGNLFTDIIAAAERAGTELAEEITQVIRIIDPLGLLRRVAEAVKTLTETGIKLFIRVLQEIKKIIRVLWELVFGKMPRWLETVLLLIDELAKAGVEILFPKLANELSQGEVNYLTEVHAARRITLLDHGNRSDDK
jgi:phage-related protein